MSEINKTTQERGVFAYGDEVIHYDIIRRSVDTVSAKPKPRKVVIKVHPDQRVVATVPNDATVAVIQEAMIKRARWIWESITEFSAQHEYVLPKQYVSGETQFYLGRRYMLKVVIDSEQTATVKLNRGKLRVTFKKDNDDRVVKIKALLDKWYLHRANIIFKERLSAMLPKTTWVKDAPSYRIMSMQKQWGSCSSKGSLMLNPHLVKAPKECIDYVILHELCHISEHNHSDRFWRLLTRVMPNWKEIKAKLDDMAELYLNE
jgi:predicted metal-dependent hydrolase